MSHVEIEGGVMTDATGGGDDWPQIKARLEEMTLPGDRGLASYRDRSDIRAALQRIEERETTECREILRLRQRVEELEKEIERLLAWPNCEECDAPMIHSTVKGYFCAGCESEAERKALRQRVEELEREALLNRNGGEERFDFTSGTGQVIEIVRRGSSR